MLRIDRECSDLGLDFSTILILSLLGRVCQNSYFEASFAGPEFKAKPFTEIRPGKPKFKTVCW